jgi:hypothetical protein
VKHRGGGKSARDVRNFGDFRQTAGEVKRGDRDARSGRAGPWCSASALPTRHQLPDLELLDELDQLLDRELLDELDQLLRLLLEELDQLLRLLDELLQDVELARALAAAAAAARRAASSASRRRRSRSS